jgi:nucleoside-specific outer membrane channel protein Tsx
MTRKRKSLLIGIIIAVVIFALCMKGRAQVYQVTHYYKEGEKKGVKCTGYIEITEQVIIVNTSLEKQSYPVKAKFKASGQTFREIDMMACRMFVYVVSNEVDLRGIWCEVGQINIYKRYQRKPEEIIRYSFKRKL